MDVCDLLEFLVSVLKSWNFFLIFTGVMLRRLVSPLCCILYDISVCWFQPLFPFFSKRTFNSDPICQRLFRSFFCVEIMKTYSLVHVPGLHSEICPWSSLSVCQESTDGISFEVTFQVILGLPYLYCTSIACWGTKQYFHTSKKKFKFIWHELLLLLIFLVCFYFETGGRQYLDKLPWSFRLV